MRLLALGLAFIVYHVSAKSDIDRFTYTKETKILSLGTTENHEKLKLVLQNDPLYVDYIFVQPTVAIGITFVGVTSIGRGPDNERAFIHDLYRWVHGVPTISEGLQPVGQYTYESFDPFPHIRSLGIPITHKMSKIGEEKSSPYLQCLFGAVSPEGGQGFFIKNTVELDRLLDLTQHVEHEEKAEQEQVKTSQEGTCFYGNMASLSSSALQSVASGLPVRRPKKFSPMPSLQDEATLILYETYMDLEARIEAEALRQAGSKWRPKAVQLL